MTRPHFMCDMTFPMCDMTFPCVIYLRLLPRGATAGRGLLRCFEAVMRVVGVEQIVTDPYTMTPHFRSGLLGGAELGNGV